MKEYFREQIGFYPTLTKEVLDRAEFKTVWSGNRMQVGDRVLYALIYVLNTDDLKAITFLERELDELKHKFRFVRYENETIPVLVFREDTKNREE